MAEKGKKERIRFTYQKARHHRTFHADGAWAGITPQLDVQFALFNDLIPTPDETTHRILESGALGEEIGRRVQQSIIREIDVTVVMNKESVKQFILILENMVQQIEDHIEKAQKTTPVQGESEPSEVS